MLSKGQHKWRLWQGDAQNVVAIGVGWAGNDDLPCAPVGKPGCCLVWGGPEPGAAGPKALNKVNLLCWTQRVNVGGATHNVQRTAQAAPLGR